MLEGLSILIFIIGSFLPVRNVPLTVKFAAGLLILADYAARWVLGRADVGVGCHARRWRNSSSSSRCSRPPPRQPSFPAGDRGAAATAARVPCAHSFPKRNDEVSENIINFGVRTVLVTALVYVLNSPSQTQASNYAVKLYCTASTPTTSGFGNIVPVAACARSWAVLVMTLGILLSTRLIQRILRPAKPRYACSNCGLSRHYRNFAFCKDCSLVLNIPSERGLAQPVSQSRITAVAASGRSSEARWPQPSMIRSFALGIPAAISSAILSGVTAS